MSYLKSRDRINNSFGELEIKQEKWDADKRRANPKRIFQLLLR